MKQDMTPYGNIVRRIIERETKMKRNIEHVYSDTIGTMIPKYVTSTHPSDVYDGTTIYETVSEDGYFCFGKDGEA